MSHTLRSALAALLLGLCAAAPALAAATTAPSATVIHKCERDGAVTYQQERCAPADPAPRPTVSQLNAARQQRLAREAAAAASAAAAQEAAARARAGTVTSAAGTAPPGAASVPGAVTLAPTSGAVGSWGGSAGAAGSAGSAGSVGAAGMAAQGGAAAPVPFHCDGRRYCSQMTSCAEAQFFLQHCPGVRMDGDRNGVPCERQWCRP